MNVNAKEYNTIFTEGEQSSILFNLKDNHMSPNQITVNADGKIIENVLLETISRNAAGIEKYSNLYKNKISSVGRWVTLFAGILLSTLLSVCYSLLPKKWKKEVIFSE